MIVSGLDLSEFDDDEEFAVVPGRTLIIDGDGPCYVAAATVKTLPTAIRRWQMEILTQMFLAECADGEVELTHETSTKAGRYSIKAIKPYQGQRTGPKPPLLSAVREAVAMHDNRLPDFSVNMNYTLEADDTMIMRAYVLKENGVIRSDDKDLRMTPYNYWDIKRGIMLPPDPVGQLWMEETASKRTCKGHSLKFFWAQMLMGDTADNIKGILTLDGKTCADVGAYNALHPIKDINEVANFVIDAYRSINQNPLPEGWLLWLLRWPGDNFWNYLSELQISPANRSFLDDCVARDWYHKETRAKDHYE